MLAALDHPVWHSLSGRQSHLSSRHGQALRLDPAYGPFAAAPSDARQDLMAFLEDSEELWLVEPEPVLPPPGAQVLRTAPLVQMVADGPLPPAEDHNEIVVLGDADSEEMTALALATRPGPWGPSTRRYGPFYGVRRQGRLAAMAGERMRPASGLVEVSGVCTWPEFRGQGLAPRLIRRVMAGLVAEGETPFLHSYADNAPAIRLYESLGFRVRGRLVATVLGKAA